MQLRDSQTSALLAEGTPLEIATLAAEFADGDVLFDGAGGVNPAGVSLFDPAEVRSSRADEITRLIAAIDELADEATDERRRHRAALRATLQDRRDRIKAGKDKAPGAKQAQADARGRVERQRRG